MWVGLRGAVGVQQSRLELRVCIFLVVFFDFSDRELKFQEDDDWQSTWRGWEWQG